MSYDADSINKLAKICHDANKAYCESIGDYSQLSFEKASDEIKQSAIDGVTRLLDEPYLTPEEVHQSWMNDKIAAGWSYGSEKDLEKKTHPCLVDYNDLPVQERYKDQLFRYIVLSYADFIESLKVTLEISEDGWVMLEKLFKSGPIEDGDVESKTTRDELTELGYLIRYNGWQTLSPTGLKVIIDHLGK